MADDQTQIVPRFPPLPKTLDYPVAVGLSLDVLCVAFLLVISKRFDPTGGALTIAMIVVTSFIGLTVAVVIWTIPPDEETATVIGALATAFGAVVAFWLRGRDHPDK